MDAKKLDEIKFNLKAMTTDDLTKAINEHHRNLVLTDKRLADLERKTAGVRRTMKQATEIFHHMVAEQRYRMSVRAVGEE